MNGRRFPMEALVYGLLLYLTVAGGTTPPLCHGAGEKTVIRVGSETDFPPFALVDEKGAATGFSVELIQAAAEAMGLVPVITTGTWDTLWKGLLEGRLEVLPLLAVTPSRRDLIDFSVPHTETFDAFFVPQGAPFIYSLLEAQGKRIMVMRSDAAHHELLERDFKGELALVDDIPQGFSLLSTGKHDALLCSKVIGEMLLREYGIKGIASGPVIGDYKRVFSFGVRKGAGELREKLNQGLKIIKADGTYDRIYERWLGIGISRSGKRLRTVIVENYYPYAFINPQGKPDGFSVELARAVTRVMGMELDVSAATWQQAVDALETGQIDFLPMMSYSKERTRLFDFSGPHTIGYDGLFVPQGTPPIRSLEELRGKRIAVMENDMAHEYLRKSGLADQNRLILIHMLPEALRLLAENRADAALVPKLVGLNTIQSLGLRHLEPDPMVVEDYNRPYSFAVIKGNQALLEKLSQGLNIVKAGGQYQEIYDRWFGKVEPRGIAAGLVIRYGALGILVAGSMGAILFTWSVTLRRQVRAKTQDLKKEIHEHLRTEAALKKSEARYAAVVNDQTELICRYLPDGTLTFVNEAYCRYFNMRREDLIGKSFVPLVHEEDRAFVQQQSGALSADNPIATYRERVYAPDGRIRRQEWISRVILDDTGKIIEFQGVGRDITERYELERLLTEASEREQRRFGQELHDGLCQDLKSLEIQMAVWENFLSAKGETTMAAEAAVLGKRVNQTVQNAYSIVKGLLPMGLEAKSIGRALMELANTIQSQTSAVIKTAIQKETSSIDPRQAYHLFRIAQEALKNALDHSHASEISMEWTCRDGQAQLLIRDNGCGFPSPTETITGMGIAVMHSRAQAIQAVLEIGGAPEGGTQVRCRCRLAGEEHGKNQDSDCG